MAKLTRRQVLGGAAAVVGPVAIGCGAVSEGTPGDANAGADAGLAPDALPEATEDAGGVTVDAALPDAPAPPSRLSVPGRVVQVAAPGAVAADAIVAARVRAAMALGMRELTGAASEEAAWKALFAPGDVVLLKVNPFGWPKVFTRPETVAEIVRGLGLAGVTAANIVVYDRYTDYLAQPGYAAQLPAGVRVVGAVTTTAEQIDPTGRDANAFVEFAKVADGLDPTVDRHRRSYLADAVTAATKVINVPVLKSHWTAGVTAALKNMTYGLVNNTARSHDGAVNWTREFLTGAASMQALRDKVVLHVADLLVACYDGGPDPSEATFTPSSLAFATDPVALDRVLWTLLDTARAQHALGPVADMPGATPQYVLDCAAAGLGLATGLDHRQLAV